MATISVVYPNRPGARFDLDYYTGRHLPLIQERWGGMGIVDSKVLRGVVGADGGQPGHFLTALLTFGSRAELDNAVATHGAEIIGDIVNFTDIMPNIQIDEPLS